MSKKTITLTGRPPVSIDTNAWPIIARADWHSGEHECQANEVALIRVRQHDDGRTLVYGMRDRGPGGMAAGYRGKAAGYLIDGYAVLDVEDVTERTTRIVDAIDRVARTLDMEELSAECVGDLPPVEL